MSNQNYITEMLELKDNNVIFKENYYYKENIKEITYKIFEGYLIYKPKCCYKCGVVFDDKFEKHGFINSDIKSPEVSFYKTILRLHKQRYLCKHCGKAFTNYGCFISNNTKHKIAKDLIKKRSEKDIALDNNVSPNTVERIMDSYYETQKIYKHSLHEVLSFDEFKSVKTSDGAMSFHMCNGITGQTIDIIEDRRLDNLIKTSIIMTIKLEVMLNLSLLICILHIFLIKNTFNNNYHNGYIEGNNNFIKVIKRIAFGFRSFKRFKARIMICKGLIKIKKIASA